MIRGMALMGVLALVVVGWSEDVQAGVRGKTYNMVYRPFFIGEETTTVVFQTNGSAIVEPYPLASAAWVETPILLLETPGGVSETVSVVMELRLLAINGVVYIGVDMAALDIDGSLTGFLDMTFFGTTFPFGTISGAAASN